MSRKLLVILSALLIAASLCACNNEGEKNTEDTINNGVENTEKESTTSEEDETDENGSQIINPGIDEMPEDLEYTEKNDTVYILHPNGAVKLHGYDDVADTSLVNGTELKRTGINEENGWSRVVYNEETYYVVSSCLTTLSDLDSDFTVVNKIAVLADGVASLNVRNAPSMDNHVVGYVYADTDIVIVAENTEDGWYKVEFTPYGSETVAYGYIVSDAKYYKSVESVTDSTEETTTGAEEATTEEETTAAAE